MSDPLAKLASRVGEDPFFLAAPLAVFASTEGLDDAGLAAALGIAADRLAELKLCRPPRPEPEHFWPDVQQIAGHFGVDAAKLADAVRRGQMVLRFRDRPAASADGAGTLLAARDADPPPPEAPP
jgi:hypothetical protein